MEHLTSPYHLPVLLQESVQGLHIRPDGVYVDLTFGAGGHAALILNQLGRHGKLFAFDHDHDAMANALHDPRFTFINANFRFLSNFLLFHNQPTVDGILADLGVSSHHFDEPHRGFSFRFHDQPLDMRMNRAAKLTAADVLNSYTLERLTSIFASYGELPHPHRLAHAILQQRAATPFHTIQHLLDTLTATYPPHRLHANAKKLHQQAFQALRIEVNDELAALRDMLSQTTSLLPPGGHLVILSYHSLEDRIVKHFLKTGNFDGVIHHDLFGNPLTPFQPTPHKPIYPSTQEIAANPRARSARLRIATRTNLSLP
ncbi:MAG: 16S rRNA (cytosine(1402)-N(4))-methyltransferase RsmH [Tannerellaceae bacterium]|nr:16S rRNA (cytosine(1402)-N(4))-methyltransferase RsmH [Tannerellaceae bacterium]